MSEVFIQGIPLAKFKPLNGFIVVRRVPQPESTQSGIVLVSKNAEQLRYEETLAVVVKVGGTKMLTKTRMNESTQRPEEVPTGVRRPHSVKVGELVSISKFAGHDATSDTGNHYVLLQEEDISCVVEPAGYPDHVTMQTMFDLVKI